MANTEMVSCAPQARMLQTSAEMLALLCWHQLGLFWAGDALTKPSVRWGGVGPTDGPRGAHRLPSLSPADARVGSVALRQCGGYAIALGTRFAFLDWDTQAVTTILELEQDKPNNRFNDGKVDPKGRFFAGKSPAEISPGAQRN